MHDSLDRLHGTLESYERQLRKLTKATEVAKLERQQSTNMVASIKSQHDRAEVTIKQQSEELKSLYDENENLKAKVAKLESKRSNCVIS